MAAVHPLAPHRSARLHVPYAAALRQRPILFRSMSSNANAEEAVMPRSVPVTLAHEFLTAGHRYLDVRTVKEFSGGHAVGAVNIPYMLESVSGNA
ncbi:hypothetical protein B296_00050090 [Ensete ventricosum]|uniref:Rhodanese domain-containing protein n=1 Tax=Ensete ventricosum TaxID=4639 RepID=A0A426YCQ7_ENSVE|nr:hypothetical protein B296_00050090 [Ensete ventricosum]